MNMMYSEDEMVNDPFRDIEQPPTDQESPNPVAGRRVKRLCSPSPKTKQSEDRQSPGKGVK